MIQIVQYEKKSDAQIIAELEREVERLNKKLKRKTSQIARLTRHHKQEGACSRKSPKPYAFTRGESPIYESG